MTTDPTLPSDQQMLLMLQAWRQQAERLNGEIADLLHDLRKAELNWSQIMAKLVDKS